MGSLQRADSARVVTAPGGAQVCGCDPPHLCTRHEAEAEFDVYTTVVDCAQCGEKTHATVKRSEGEVEVACESCGTLLLVEHVEYLVSRVVGDE